MPDSKKAVAGYYQAVTRIHAQQQAQSQEGDTMHDAIGWIVDRLIRARNAEIENPEPAPVICGYPGCETVARPNGYLCVGHFLVEDGA